ncbi:hypothetical protein CYMTET_6714 [Cymbomonas tetramitiformis]|uniref:Reverse transcriptase/retrotransposon-derived protein RNase H-like domain-containing protein n=1 Tax=Cymbomonas tetramitiformis TaxID=36881 RepID=A0AAE0LHT0_9CHLO|nr:hypothetical protein CYMTET_6714 [Cymbomonas tetramitiformis]
MAEAAKDGLQGVFAAVASDLPGEEKDFFTKYSETLRKALPEASKLRRTTEDMARITRKADAEGGPPCRRPYRMSVEELRQLRERVEQLMEKGYIRPSCSPYAAPCLMVLKPGDPKTLRLVVDYRQLNQQTGNDIEAHYNHVKQFLDTCQEAGVYLKDSKAQMCKESLRFLGHTLSAKGCQPQHDKVAAIKDWPRLETVTQVRQFLGLAGYYRRFVHCFSEIAQPLTSLTKTDVPWEWGEQQQWAFEELKPALSSAPVLALPDIKKAADGTAPFLVQTDASGVALGGMLMQDTGEGLKFIAYESRQFSAAEQNYRTGERELCALHHCTTVTWRHYLIFSEFGLQGDHRPLEWLMSPGRELSRRQARCYMDLVEVGVPRMEYVKGALLLVPDALSRRADYAVNEDSA